MIFLWSKLENLVFFWIVFLSCLFVGEFGFTAQFLGSRQSF